MRLQFSAFYILFFLSLSSPIKAQEELGKTYKIIDNGSALNIQPYIDALNNSNMKNHRLKNKRYTIIFNTGVKVELYSATELIQSGRKVNSDDYPENFDSSRLEPMFYLGQNNYIMEEHRNISKLDK